MDRTVEFGSEEFFRKQRASEQAAAAAAAAAAQNGSPSTVASATASRPPTFVLPLGNPRPPTGKRRASNDATKSADQKIRSVGHDLSTSRNDRSFPRPLAGIRSKIPTLHKPVGGHLNDGILVEEPVKRRRALWDLFDSLPTELQFQIISLLPLGTLLDVRLVCKSFHKLVSTQEGPIVRHHVKHNIPSYALRLYPLPDNSELNLRYLCGIWHRLHVVFRLNILITEYVTREIFLRKDRQKREEFEPQYRRMRRRLMPLVFVIFHFFETYRRLHLEHLKSGGTPLSRQAYTINPIERQVLSTYSDETLLKTHEVYQLVLSSFSYQLRVPSYVGKLELIARGWNGDRPSDEIYLAILMIGGLGQAKRFWQIKNYNDRRHALDMWYNSISSTLSQKSSTAKSKISRLSPFHRKRSTTEAPTIESFNGHEAASCKDWFCANAACREASTSSHHHHSNASNTYIYHSSLSAGPPMAPIPREDCLLLLSDPLQLMNTWFATAEVEILRRGIIDNINKMKTGTAVLLSLISEIPSPDDIHEEWFPRGDFHGGLRNNSMEYPDAIWQS